jgi:hypothetical protein
MPGNSISARRTAAATLQASTVDLVYLTEGGFGVQVINDTGASPIYFTVSAPGGACTAPTVAASTGTVGVFCAAAAGIPVNVRHDGMFGSIVQLISSGTPSYVVSVVGNQING